MCVTVEFDWERVGEIAVQDGRLVFPTLPKAAGLYRMAFTVTSGSASVYIGEASDLARRVQHYRTPGPGQTTNVRLNGELRSAIARGVAVEMSIITAATISIADEPAKDLQLSRKTSRLIVENAAMAEVLSRESSDPASAELINRPGVGEGGWDG